MNKVPPYADDSAHVEMNSVIDKQQSGAKANGVVLKLCGGKYLILFLFLMSWKVALTCARLGACASRKVIIVPLCVCLASSGGHRRPAADGYSNRPESLGGV